MAEPSNRSPRRRPVDLLFGEDVQLKPAEQQADTKQSTPGYMVESPRPVTSLRPPPPEFPNDWRATAPPEPAAMMELPVEIPAQPDPVAPPPKPPVADLPAMQPIVEAITFTTPPDDKIGQTKRIPMAEIPPMPIFMAQTPPATSPPPVVPTPSPAPATPYGQTELLELSQFVDQLYQNVADETSDSAALNAECLANLNAARISIENGEYSKAEASAEKVKARLLRARVSRTAAAAQTTRLLFGGLIFAALVGAVLFIVPFFLRLVPVIVPLLRGAGLGMLGGAAMGLFQLSQHIARREYDAEFNPKYTLSPIFGALLGAVMYLLSILGILAAPNALGAPDYSLMYLFALLGGIFNDAVIGGLRSLLPKTK